MKSSTAERETRELRVVTDAALEALAARAEAPPEPASPERRVFKASRDWAGPDAITRDWIASEHGRPGEAGIGISDVRRRITAVVRRRAGVLAIGCACAAALLYTALQSEPPHVEAVSATDESHATDPTSLEEQKEGQKKDDAVAGAAARPVPADPDEQLAAAIAAWEQNQLPEALVLFRRIAARGDETAAKFMVDLVEARLRERTP